MTPKLLVLAALAGALPLVEAPNAPVPKQTTFQRHWESCVDQGRKRNNGVLLTANVKEHTAEKLIVEWGFDYTGPRQPLNILSPVRPDSKDLFPYTAAVTFFATGANGFPYMEGYADAKLMTADGKHFPYEGVRQQRGYYLTVEKGKKATVELEVPIRQHLKKFQQTYSEQFNKQPPEKLYFILTHQPKLRGELFDLDAWTGELSSEPILLDSRKSWPDAK